MQMKFPKNFEDIEYSDNVLNNYSGNVDFTCLKCLVCQLKGNFVTEK